MTKLPDARLFCPSPTCTIEDGVNIYDISSWPEDVRPALKAFCLLWHFRPPALSRRDQKAEREKRGRAADWILSLREINDAAGEFRADELLKEYREEFDSYMRSHHGLAPFPITRPGSLVNSIAGIAARKREAARKDAGEKYVTGEFAEFVQH